MKQLRRVILEEKPSKKSENYMKASGQLGRTMSKTRAGQASTAELTRHTAGRSLASAKAFGKIGGKYIAGMMRSNPGPRVTTADELEKIRKEIGDRRSKARSLVSHTSQPLTAGRVFMFEKVSKGMRAAAQSAENWHKENPRSWFDAPGGTERALRRVKSKRAGREIARKIARGEMQKKRIGVPGSKEGIAVANAAADKGKLSSTRGKRVGGQAARAKLANQRSASDKAGKFRTRWDDEREDARKLTFAEPKKQLP